MTTALITLGVLFGLYVLASGSLIVYLLRGTRGERERLEDRLMAMSNQPALITHKALTDPEPAEINYVDEARELQLQRNGNVDLIDDDDED